LKYGGFGLNIRGSRTPRSVVSNPSGSCIAFYDPVLEVAQVPLHHFLLITRENKLL
jgi:hypothetical protein